ncbi:MAG: cold shock domain-containing protein [Acidobacteriota bacterium]|nr:cold shock domain-containing protein [Acidobacteriota bacterium]
MSTPVRLTGTLIRWFSGRGFGFIRPADGTADLFLTHHEVYGSSLHVGDRVSFLVGLDRNRQHHAVDARIAKPTPPSQVKSPHLTTRTPAPPTARMAATVSTLNQETDHGR